MLRILLTRDLPAEAELWKAGFPDDSKEYIEDYITTRSEAFLALYDETALAAGLHIVPCAMDINGYSVSAGIIAGVATKPEYRHRGYASRLMLAAHEHMAARGMKLSLLEPFLDRFYQPFGYVTFAYKKKLRSNGGVASALCDGGIDAIKKIYFERAARATTSIKRTSRDFDFLLRDAGYDGFGLYVSNDAYALARVGETEVECMECVSSNVGGELMLLNALERKFARPAVAYVQCGENAVGAEGKLMARPLDMAELLRAYAGLVEDIAFEIDDASFGRIAGLYSIASDKSVSRGSAGQHGALIGSGELTKRILTGGEAFSDAGNVLALESY